MTFAVRPYRHFLTVLASGLAFETLIALEVLSSVSAYVEGVSIGYSDSRGGYTVYVDPSTISPQRGSDEGVGLDRLYNHANNSRPLLFV
jgi:hypothetical protein